MKKLLFLFFLSCTAKEPVEILEFKKVMANAGVGTVYVVSAQINNDLDSFDVMINLTYEDTLIDSQLVKCRAELFQFDVIDFMIQFRYVAEVDSLTKFKYEVR